MRELLRRALDEVRSWFGWKDLSDTRLSPAHGWLLQTTATVRTGHERDLDRATSAATSNRERR
jgi:hypothetical protein